MLGVITKEFPNEIVMEGEYMRQAVDYILSSLRDPHPHVRWGAYNLMQQRTDFVSAIQLLHHHKLLPLLVAGLDENQFPDIVTQAASAIKLFVHNVHPQNLAAFADMNGLMNKLLKLTESSDIAPNCRKILWEIYEFVSDKLQPPSLPSPSGSTT